MALINHTQWYTHEDRKRRLSVRFCFGCFMEWIYDKYKYMWIDISTKLSTVYENACEKSDKNRTCCPCRCKPDMSGLQLHDDIHMCKDSHRGFFFVTSGSRLSWVPRWCLIEVGATRVYRRNSYRQSTVSGAKLCAETMRNYVMMWNTRSCNSRVIFRKW